jgi:hypothetical protein
LEVIKIERTLAFRIDEEFHRELKIKLAERGITLKSYVLGLIEKDLRDQQDTQLNVEAIRATAERMQENVNELLALTES